MFTNQIKELREIKTIEEFLEKRKGTVLVYGLTDSQKAHIAYYIMKKFNKKVLIIVPDEVQARKMYEDLNSFTFGNASLFPKREVLFYKIDAASQEIISKRLQVMKRLTEEGAHGIVASVDAALGKLIPLDLFKKYRFNIKVNDIINLEGIVKRLVRMGYERVQIVEGKGQFSIRGGIIDIFPPTEENPYRIDLFDDEVDSIRIFDVITQRSLEKVSGLEIFPATEFIAEEENIKKGITLVSSYLNSYLAKIKKSKSGIAEKLQKKFEGIMEEISETKRVENIYELIDYFYDEVYSIIDYIGEDGIVILDESNRIKERAENIQKEFNENFKVLLEKGEVLPEQSNFLFDYHQFLKRLENKFLLVMNTLSKPDSELKPQIFVNFVSRSMHPFHGKLEILVDDLKYYKSAGYKVVLLSGNKDRARILKDTLYNYEIDSAVIEDSEYDIQKGQVVIYPASINKGFEYVDAKFAVISDGEIFGQTKRSKKPVKMKNADMIKSYAELEVGSYVVHVNYGIGKYEGIEKIKVDGIIRDYLKIIYAGGDTLFVPVEQLDLVQKYVGPTDNPPKLNKLGGSEWLRAKRKAKKAVEDLAKDLIQLYAKRQMAKGHAFSPDTPWQKEFEDQFPYEETEDQLRCIKEIKEDMEKNRPMDRLLCGDVGYGKTEVALRAAFKAVADGKQVAFLCPTTILAYQHYTNFVERFKEFPVKIEMLSRFRTPKEQTQILKGLAEGSIDIIVGTHRLLQNDVKFKDLGLLIIDEEQRFGVVHKEKIKKLKESIDVLTLSATPIPRTLHMSLIGIRDMSVLENPPEDRFPVETYVVEFNEELIKDAILREMGRGGQVYFVYNRVNGIEKMAYFVKELVPNCRVAVAHGQMEESQLERVMIDFLNGEYDVLVSTTIIETGLDIPNVNTIIVYDADKLGLSQLYQLRGRVGRSNRLAYAYFTYRKDKVLSEVAEKRLEAIKEFTEFGSGFKIAMRDLEIRGAGNLLGAEQHGHIDAIGYDLYLKLLEDAIRNLKGETPKEEVTTTIDIKVNAYIDSSYIEDENLRLEMYKKIASIESKEDMAQVSEELIDRFGDYSKPVETLLEIAYLKSIASKLYITEIAGKGNNVILKFKDMGSVNMEVIEKLVKEYGGNLIFSSQVQPYLTYKFNKKETLQKELIDLVEKIKNLQLK
ncbi:MAG TPA: transcription-repair coupling factor [Clostridia bacterium]|nr:transcription-repair coupling factor [Clostridia bacterium]